MFPPGTAILTNISFFLMPLKVSDLLLVSDIHICEKKKKPLPAQYGGSLNRTRNKPEGVGKR